MRRKPQSFTRCTAALRALAVALALLSPAAISATVAADGPPRPPEEPLFHDGRSVVRAVVATPRDVRTVLAIAKDVLNHRIDVGPVDFIVDADGLRALAKSGLAHEVLVADLGPVLRADFAARARRGGAGGDGGVAGGGGFFDDFRRLEEIEAHLAALVAARPDLVTPFTIGTSLEGRPIRGVRITKAPAGSPGILFNATQHAREWGATTTACFIADRLVALEGSDPRVTALLSRAWVDVIPVVNPDGYVYSWDVNRLWRKNRRNNGNGSFGVDLNRNWAFQWGGGGASTNPDSETYRGPSAFSEPESAAMRDYFVANATLVGHIDFHSYSQLVLSPWGYTTAPPPNAAGFNALGLEMRDAIERATGTAYVAGPIASTLSIASGSSVDHAFGVHGVISWTIEVRDKGTYGFVMPASEIVPNATENLAAALELAEAAVDGAVVRLSGGARAVVEPDLAAPVAAEVRVMRGAAVAGGVRLFARIGSSGAFTETPMTETAPASFAASLPAAPCGARIEWYIEAATTVGVARSPRGPGAVHATQAIATQVLFTDTFETNLGWSAGVAGDTATSGLWTRVDPVGTIAQPENDSDDPGTLCFVTGQGVPGGAAGAADVDNGVTTLLSPRLDASHPESRIAYRRWYSNNLGGAPNADSMPISISGDDGGTWVLLEDVVENRGAWIERSFRVADFVTPGASVRLRFVARDLGQASLVEAGVDAVRVFVQECPPVEGDLNGDGTVNGADLTILLGAWGGAGPADLDGSGTVDASDLTRLLALWS